MLFQLYFTIKSLSLLFLLTYFFPAKFDTEKFIDVHQIKFTGFRCPRPLFKFEHAGFPGNSKMTCFFFSIRSFFQVWYTLYSDYITKVIESQESTYPRPTATQCFCWPVLLSGRDIILVSNSGYGKHLSVSWPWNMSYFKVAIVIFNMTIFSETDQLI